MGLTLDQVYALIYGSKVIQSRTEEHPDYEKMIQDDPVELLKMMNVSMNWMML